MSTSEQSAKNELKQQQQQQQQQQQIVFSNRRSSPLKKLLRVSILFLLGSSLCFVLNILQMEYKANLFPHNVMLFLKTNWFYMPMCGLVATYIGVSYPFFDHKLGLDYQTSSDESPDWTVIIRSFAFFIGLNHLIAVVSIFLVQPIQKRLSINLFLFKTSREFTLKILLISLLF